MLGRRQIREKIVEILYSYHQNPIAFDQLEKKLFLSISKIYDLYIYQLNFLVALKDYAEYQQENAKNKFLKTEEDLNPNLKFIQNRVLLQLEANPERLNFNSKHKNVQWELHDELLVKTYQRMKNGKRYQDYMASTEDSWDEDQKFIGKLFLRYIAENEDFHSHLEDRELSWADDLHIANSMVQKTIGFLKENEPVTTLIKMIKNDDDEEFARKLLRSALDNWESTEKKMEERLVNWEIDRISLMDRIIIIAAISELDAFPFTASRIIINEYIEISKVFSTAKSNTFINGLLDKYTKDINRI